MKNYYDKRWIITTLCIMAGVLGAALVVLYAGNHGYVTPLYTWMATV